MPTAYCFRGGVIDIASHKDTVPDGAIPFVSTRKSTAKLLAAIEVRARHAYDGKTLLVPGIPEAANDADALAALEKWSDWAFPGGKL